MTHEELVAKAREVKSAEELKELAKAEGMELTEEAAGEYYAMLNPESGEISDDELDNVSGGGCKTTVNGKKYTVVTSGLKCFTGQYKKGSSHRENQNLRIVWSGCSSYGCCGTCEHLSFKAGTGYCSKA